MNLLSNAIDVLEDRNAQLSSQEIADRPSRIVISTSAIDNDWISIRISDNGLGIAEELIPRLFDPFFTTKIVGKGTGLGLYISYQIVADKHHGKLYCRSKLGEGTEFIVELPLRQAPTHTKPALTTSSIA